MGGKSSKGSGGPHRGELVKSLSGHEDTVLCCEFSSDGRYLASCSADGTMIIWNVKKLRVMHCIKAHKAETNAVSFSPDSTSLLSCGGDWKVNMWDVKTGKLRFSSRLARGAINHCCFAPDTGNLFATASHENTVAIWELKDDRVKKQVFPAGHRDIVFQVCFSPDCIHLASCSNDRRIILWNRSTGKVVAKLKDEYSRVLTCQYNHDGMLLAAVVDGEKVRIWNTMTHDIAFVLEGHHLAPILSCKFSSDGGILATVSGDKTYALWDTNEPSSLPLYHGRAHDGWIQTVAFSQDGLYLATGSTDRKLNIWI